MQWPTGRVIVFLEADLFYNSHHFLHCPGSCILPPSCGLKLVMILLRSTLSLPPTLGGRHNNKVSTPRLVPRESIQSPRSAR